MIAYREPDNLSCLCHKGVERDFYAYILLLNETWRSRHKVEQASVCKHIHTYSCMHTYILLVHTYFLPDAVRVLAAVRVWQLSCAVWVFIILL